MALVHEIDFGTPSSKSEKTVTQRGIKDGDWIKLASRRAKRRCGLW